MTNDKNPLLPKPQKLRYQIDLQSMVIPGIILVILFSYLPIWGVLISFQDVNIESSFRSVQGFLNTPWVGLKHFEAFFFSRDFIEVMRNTFFISGLKLLFVFTSPIILALLFNEIRLATYKRVLQTVTYLPNFVSWVTVSGLIFALFAADSGGINEFLIWIGAIKQSYNFFNDWPSFYSILIGTNMWKTMGFSSIVYLAAISSIDPTLYEAAQMDGLNRLKQAWYITLPSIIPIIVIFLVLNIASILSAGFDDIWLLSKQGKLANIREYWDVLDTYVYRTGIISGRYSYAAAAGLFKAVVSVVLLWIGNRFARKLSGASLW